MKENREERFASVALIVFSAAYLVGGFFIPMPVFKQQLGPGAFPIAIGIGMLILACIYAWQQFRGGAKANDENEETEKRAVIIGAEEKIEKKADLKTMGFMLVAMLFYAFAFERLGYAISTFVVFMAGVLYLDRRHLVRDAVIAVISSFVLYYIFSVFLRVNLPAGPLKFLEF
ncbi:MAG: tripartite tricarboxylate transporter TctB family protein [Syntrophales bacterium]|nr:tripartite tricarboxylate transporter TctB family protein [Syntrophales bacterium]